jgi:hypothetical protein
MSTPREVLADETVKADGVWRDWPAHPKGCQPRGDFIAQRSLAALSAAGFEVLPTALVDAVLDATDNYKARMDLAVYRLSVTNQPEEQQPMTTWPGTDEPIEQVGS